MARKVATFTITKDGRDKGKTFQITEMSAAQAESWATRAILALMSNGVKLPDGFEKMGMAGMAQLGIRALSGLKYDDIAPLLDEMWVCVKFVSSAGHIRAILDEADDIEEVSTRIEIRNQIFKLHIDFLEAAASMNQVAGPAAEQ